MSQPFAVVRLSLEDVALVVLVTQQDRQTWATEPEVAVLLAEQASVAGQSEQGRVGMAAGVKPRRQDHQLTEPGHLDVDGLQHPARRVLH